MGPRAKIGLPYIYFLRGLCTTGGPIRIERVVAADSGGGLTVTSWGVSREVDGAADTDADANSVLDMYGWSHAAVAVKCGSIGAVDAFAVSVATPSPRGTMTGVNIFYRVDGSTHHIFSQWFVALCSGEDCPPPGPSDVHAVGLGEAA